MTVIKGNDVKVYKRRLMIQYLIEGAVFFLVYSLVRPLIRQGRIETWDVIGVLLFIVLVVQGVRYTIKRKNIKNSEVCLIKDSDAPSVAVRTQSSRLEEKYRIFSIDHIDLRRSGMVVIGEIKAKYVELSEEGKEHESMAERIVIPPCFKDMKEIEMRMQEHLKSV